MYQVDRNSSTPIFKQLKNDLLDLLETDKFSEGDKLPTERELQELYGVSRATVRSAVSELELEGYLERIQGVGTLVTKPKIRPAIMKLTSFSEDMRSRGYKPGSKTLHLELCSPSARISKKLGIDEAEEVWYLRRLRFANGEPIGIHDLYIPPTLEFAPHDLKVLDLYYRLLVDKHGIEPARAQETLTARIANSDEAELLNVQNGSPVLVIERITFTNDDDPIEFVQILYRADFYEYQVSLYR